MPTSVVRFRSRGHLKRPTLKHRTRGNVVATMKRAFILGGVLALGGCRGDAAEQPGEVAGPVTMPASESTASLKVGDPAPAFSLPDANGQMVSLAESHAGGPAVLVFYRGDW